MKTIVQKILPEWSLLKMRWELSKRLMRFLKRLKFFINGRSERTSRLMRREISSSYYVAQIVTISEQLCFHKGSSLHLVMAGIVFIGRTKGMQKNFPLKVKTRVLVP